MKTREVIDYLNGRLIPSYQENYDNAGFLVGDINQPISGVLTTTDVTPEVIDEAISLKANLIVSHHPLIFSGIKHITTANETGRMIMKLLSEKICVYAAHTNFDNLDWGVNGILAKELGLTSCRILRPLGNTLRKLVTYTPLSHADKVRQALFNAGAGSIGNYDHCSWNCDGSGTFRADDNCNPFCGEIGQDHTEPETRIEIIYEQRIERQLIHKLKEAHPYEEPAFDCIPLANNFDRLGAGMVGKLATPMTATEFFSMVKQQLGIPVIRVSHSNTLQNVTISRVAICGGSGSFLIGDAKACGADIYLTSDLKYHDFQQAENEIILADIGHFESEQFAKKIFCSIISEKFSNFACRISAKDCGYIKYI